MEKILVALSGGVDSAVAMALLKQRGEAISAAYMKTWMNEEGGDTFGDCPWHQDIIDARACSEKLSVKFDVVDFIEEYRSQIVDYLVEEYRLGMTPNPDVMCNRKIKFGKFLDYALKRGFQKVATGHYCTYIENPDASRDLAQGADPAKDQSYFLCMITQQQLMHAEFPIGSLLKSEVRELARINGLPNAEKKDSQGICFLGKVKIRDFLSRYIPQSEGDIVKTDGTVIGTHKGLHNYTIGQRKGMGVPSNTDKKSYVVLSKDYSSNRLVVGFDSPEAPNLWRSEAMVSKINWINKPFREKFETYARVRYRDPLVKIIFEPLEGNRARVVFEKKQRAIAPGQILAIHSPEQNTVLGGAVFC